MTSGGGTLEGLAAAGASREDEHVMTEADVRATAEGIADTIASIEAGTLDATPAQRAYLDGSLAALRGVLDDGDHT